MRRLVAAALVAVGCAGFLVACSDGNGQSSGGTTPDSTSSETTGEVPVPSTRPEGDVTREEVAVGEQVDLGDGLLVEVVSVVAGDLEAHTPGEIAGPGVVVTVEVTNTTGGEVDLVGFVVNARSGEGGGAPAPPNPTAGVALEGILADGATATGTYAFRVAPDDRGTISVEIEHALANVVAVVVVGDAVT